MIGVFLNELWYRDSNYKGSDYKTVCKGFNWVQFWHLELKIFTLLGKVAASQQISDNYVFSFHVSSSPVSVFAVTGQLSSSYLLVCGAYRKMALKVERISLASVVASWPPVLTKPTRSPFLRGRITLKDTEPPQPQLPLAELPYWPAAGPAELWSFWTLRLDTDRTASMRSPCFAVSRPEIRYRPSTGTVNIPVELRKGAI